MTGVLIASKDKYGRKACTIPKSCEGKMVQTRYIDQSEFFSYIKQSWFGFVPQVHDASPRAAAQFLSLNTPILMNYHLVGGWKYCTEDTGEFFHDMSDFRESMERVLRKAKAGEYMPRKHMITHYGDEIMGKKFKQFVEDNFADRITLPKDCRLLLPGPFH